MATPEKSLSAFAALLAPSTEAYALVYDPSETLPENRTRLVPLASISQRGVYLVTGNPEGVQSTPGPAIAVSTSQGLWSRPVATPGNTGWIELIAPNP